jgi:hypothetical protein
MSATDDVEISTAVADAIASWRRVFAEKAPHDANVQTLSAFPALSAPQL